MAEKKEKLETWPIEKLIAYANNPRINDGAVDQMAAAIHEFGFKVPIVAKSDGTVVDGHLRLKAAKRLELKTVPVLLADDLTDTQIKAFRLSVNRMAELAEWDTELLALEIEELSNLDFDLDLIGFDEDFLDSLLTDDEDNAGLTDDDEVPEPPETPVTVEGDLWVLGDHRLLCGNSTNIDAIERVMDGQKADITFTSPPYNVGTTPNGDKQKYANDSDNKTHADYLKLLDAFTTNCLLVSDFVFSNIQSLSGNKIALIEHLYNMRVKFADTIIWDKKTAEPAMARRVLNSRFEYIHIFSNEAKRTIGKRDFRGTIPNIFELNSRQGKEFAKIHKATFPVQLPAFFIENFTESSCLDPFSGTGTTLIACEKLKRNCFCLELDPKYCDIIINRWQNFSGNQVVHENGQTFAEIAKQRVNIEQ